MESKRRAYWLGRLEKENVQRSLQGAASRSFSGRVALRFITKTVVLPEKYFQIKFLAGGAWLDAYTEGTFFEDFLEITITGYDSEIDAWFEDDARIKLCEIEGPIYVKYRETVSSDPEENHYCFGWQICGGQCLCDGCPTDKEQVLA